MVALSMTVALLLSSGANPELFGFTPVESITGPPDEAGEVSWSTGELPAGPDWRPTLYDRALLTTVFGEPTQVAPDTRGWAFAHVDAPEFGVVLVPVRGTDTVRALSWDYGNLPGGRTFQGWRLTGAAGSAWLDALADFQREVLPSGEGR